MDENSKIVTIIVNGKDKDVNKDNIEYNEVVILAFGSYVDDDRTIYTITYSRGHSDREKGTLVKGKSVKVKEGMIFNVARTDRS